VDAVEVQGKRATAKIDFTTPRKSVVRLLTLRMVHGSWRVVEDAFLSERED
jgi:hypothetical protein